MLHVVTSIMLNICISRNSYTALKATSLLRASGIDATWCHTLTQCQSANIKLTPKAVLWWRNHLYGTPTLCHWVFQDAERIMNLELVDHRLSVPSESPWMVQGHSVLIMHSSLEW